MNVFIDTCTVNYFLRIDKAVRVKDVTNCQSYDITWQENIKYLYLIKIGPVSEGKIVFFINEEVRNQIAKVKDEKLRKELFKKCDEYKFNNLASLHFPLEFPLRFIKDDHTSEKKEKYAKYPNLVKDYKILDEAGFDKKIEILLTTDRKLAHQAIQINNVKIMLPKELWDYWKNSN